MAAVAAVAAVVCSLQCRVAWFAKKIRTCQPDLALISESAMSTNVEHMVEQLRCSAPMDVSANNFSFFLKLVPPARLALWRATYCTKHLTQHLREHY